MSLLDRRTGEFDPRLRQIPEAGPLDENDLKAMEQMRQIHQLVITETERLRTTNPDETLTRAKILELDRQNFGRGFAVAIDEAMKGIGDSVS